MSDIYRVGIIGCGEISRWHSDAYRECARTELVAAADIDKAHLKEYSQEYDVKALYTDYKEMLSNEKLDIVSICTYPPTHRDITRDVAQSRVKGIYCEKPMCMNLAEADDMLAVCEKNGVQLIINHQRRFERYYVKAKEILDSGAIGKLCKIENSPLLLDIMEFGAHWIDLMYFFNNDVEAEWVFGQIDRRYDFNAYGHRLETECISYIKFKNGVRGFYIGGDHALDEGCFHRITGTKGRIEINMTTAPPGVITRALVLGEKDWIVPKIPGDMLKMAIEAVRLSVEALVESIETGKPHPLNGRSARAGLEIIMATFESALTGKLIELPLKRKESPMAIMLDRVGIPYITGRLTRDNFSMKTLKKAEEDW